MIRLKDGWMINLPRRIKTGSSLGFITDVLLLHISNYDNFLKRITVDKYVFDNNHLFQRLNQMQAAFQSVLQAALQPVLQAS